MVIICPPALVGLTGLPKMSRNEGGGGSGACPFNAFGPVRLFKEGKLNSPHSILLTQSLKKQSLPPLHCTGHNDRCTNIVFVFAESKMSIPFALGSIVVRVFCLV